jgi:hypothetical protein
MSWFYISFVSDKFLGACLVHASDEKSALIESKNQGCNPGGEAMVVWIEPEKGEPPKDIQNVLFTDKAVMQEKFSAWLGQQGAQTETVKERRERGGHLGAAIVCEGCNDDLGPSYD